MTIAPQSPTEVAPSDLVTVTVDGIAVRVPVDEALADMRGLVDDVIEVDDADDRMQKKIRTAQKSKVPYMLIAGDDDMAAGAVSFRYGDGSQRNGVSIDDAVNEIVAAVRDRQQVESAPS